MTFTLNGKTITQTGENVKRPNENTVLADVGNSFFSVTQDAVYTMAAGSVFSVQGTLTDTTARFHLVMEAGSKLLTENGGSFTVGKVDNGVYSGGGVLTVVPSNQGSYNQDIIGYLNGTKLEFYGSTLNLYSKDSKRGSPNDYFFTGISGSRINGIDKTGNSGIFSRLRLRANSHFSDNVLIGVSGVEFHGASTFKRNSFTNLKDAFVAFDAGAVITIPDANFSGELNSWGWISNGGITYINVQANGELASDAFITAKKGIVDVRGYGGNTLPANERKIRFSKTNSEILVDEAGATINSGVTVRFKNNENNIFTPALTSGKYSQEILLKESTANAGGGYSLHNLAFKNFFTIIKSIYGYNFVTQQQTFDTYDSFPVIGNKGDVLRTIKPDTTITETNKDTVIAYPSLDTAAKFYDRMKAWRVDNYNGETKPIVQRIEKKIDAGNYDVIIDPNASLNGSVDGKVITIKAAVFKDNITTAGTVSLVNGAKVLGTVIDKNADSALRFVGLDAWSVYNTAPNNRFEFTTAPLGQGTSGNFRFIYSPNKPFYVAATVSGQTTLINVTPTAIGETTVSLETASILGLLQSSVTLVHQDVVKCTAHARRANLQTIDIT